jgi:2-hydroxy-6-oxonona-2,4-dienedioate hydrolase
MKLNAVRSGSLVCLRALARRRGLAILCSLLVGCATQSIPTDSVSRSASIGGHEAKFVDVNGARTRYYDVGSGEPILLIHGARPSGTSNANTWVPILTGLSKRFRVLAPDRLGHGMTENPNGDYSVTAEMEHPYNFIKVMKLERFHIMGQSTGAYHAARMTLEHPEMIKTLILADSATLSPAIGNVAERRAAIGLGTGAGARSPGATVRDQFRFSMEALSKNRGHITEEFVPAAAYMASLPNGQKTDAAMRGDAAKRYEEIISKGAEEMRRWIKEGRLQTPTLLYWGKNDPSAIPVVGLALFDMLSEKNRPDPDAHRQQRGPLSLPRAPRGIRPQRHQLRHGVVAQLFSGQQQVSDSTSTTAS